MTLFIGCLIIILYRVRVAKQTFRYYLVWSSHPRLSVD